MNLDDDVDGEDESEMDDASYSGVGGGKAKYDQMIKSMIARIEFSNALAPISEYGRHQQRAAGKKKKQIKKKKKVGEGGEQMGEESEEGADTAGVVDQKKF